MENQRTITHDAGYAALREGAAVVELPRTVLRLVGRDPIGMLGAVLTNEIPEELARGCYAALLDHKGRVQTDLRVFKGDSEVLIDTEPGGAEAAKDILGRYAPFSRVKIEDLGSAEEPWGVLGLYGPRAEELLDGPELAEHETARVEIGGATLLAVGVSLPVPGYDLLGPASGLRAAGERLAESGAAPASREAYETARVEAGVPRFGADLTTDNFPAEAGILDRAVSFEKGCYPGQETVARMHYRGSPNKRLHRLRVDGEPPEPGAVVRQNGKDAGWISSVAPLPVNGETLALGYLRRSADPDGLLHTGEATVSMLTG